ncbi:MAG: transposase, partial [Gammaproteobacteria bacterium]
LSFFYTDDDFNTYLYFLKSASKQELVAIHSYVLMSNHVHLLVTPECKGGVARMMSRLARDYTDYFNFKYYRSGDLFNPRMQSCLIDADNYLLSSQRYIELNPVHAGLVKHPLQYSWSSYGVNAHGDESELITAHGVYEALGVSKPDRYRSYRSLFKDQLTPTLVKEISEHLHGEYCLGSDSFKKRIEAMLGRQVVRGNPVGSEIKVQLRSLCLE